MQRMVRFFIALPTLLGSLFACALCPMCIPIYASIFAAMGIDLVHISPYLIVLMGVSMIATLTMIYSHIQHHQTSWISFYVALISAIGIVMTKFQGSTYLMYICLGLFFTSALWNRAQHHHRS